MDLPRLRDVPRIILGVITLALASMILAPPMLVIVLFVGTSVPGQVVQFLWTRSVALALGIRTEVHGLENIRPGESYIITSNHQSYVEIPALVQALPVSFRWVVKRELLRIPFFGWGLAGTGAIAIDRSNPGASLSKLEAGRSKLGRGWSILVYPEGTRTHDGSIGPFKRGAFIMAVQAGVPILPVTVNGAYKILPRKSIAFRPGRVRVTVSPPISTKGLTESDVPDLIKRTREVIESQFDPDYDPFGEAARDSRVERSRSVVNE